MLLFHASKCCQVESNSISFRQLKHTGLLHWQDWCSDTKAIHPSTSLTGHNEQEIGKQIPQVSWSPVVCTVVLKPTAKAVEDRRVDKNSKPAKRHRAFFCPHPRSGIAAMAQQAHQCCWSIDRKQSSGGGCTFLDIYNKSIHLSLIHISEPTRPP